MSLRNQVALVLGIALGLVFCGSLLIQQLIVLPQLRAIEAEADRQSVARIQVGFNSILQQMSSWSRDYGVWSTTYDFMRGKGDPNYLDVNYTVDTYLNADLQGIALIDNQGKSFYHREVDLAKEDFLGHPRLPFEALLPLLPSTKAPREDDPGATQGIAQTSLCPMLYAAIHVLSSIGTTDSPGYVIAYRCIDASLFERITNVTQQSFDVIPVGDTANLSRETEHRDPGNRIQTVVRDNHGNALFRLSIKLSPSTIEDSTFSVNVQFAFAMSAVAFAVLLFLLDRQVVARIRRIVDHLHTIRDTSDYSLRLHGEGRDELAVLDHECDDLIAKIEEQQKVLLQQTVELRELSHRDALSGLDNRRRFDEGLVDYCELSRRNEAPLALLLCDLDAFKNYNDTLGHQAGDEIIRRFGALMRKTVPRKSDLCCRYGGEEFAVLLPDTNYAGAAAVAMRLQARLRDEAIPHPASQVGPHLTLSIGIAVSEAAKDTDLKPEDLVERADKALYAAKKAGRNQSYRFDAFTPSDQATQSNPR